MVKGKKRIKELEAKLEDIRSKKPSNMEEKRQFRAREIKTLSKLAEVEADYWEDEAFRYGINIPTDKVEWWDIREKMNGEVYYQKLNPYGINAVKRLIRDEKRSNIKFWTGIIVSVLTAIAGVIGTIIGLIGILLQSNTN